MHEIPTRTLPLAIAVFVAGAMFSLWLVPLWALGLAGAIPMDRASRIGFLLYAFSAGVKSGPKFVQVAKGNAAFAWIRRSSA